MSHDNNNGRAGTRSEMTKGKSTCPLYLRIHHEDVAVTEYFLYVAPHSSNLLISEKKADVLLSH